MGNLNWQCPFCGRHSVIVGESRHGGITRIDLPTKHGRQALHSFAIACPNEECKELFLKVYLTSYDYDGAGDHTYGDIVRERLWTLLPQAAVKPFPEYVPAPIRADYREACLIRELSPKASATLARRCLQGMIWDFWQIRKTNLYEEVGALKEKVDDTTWGAIDAIRELGNIGAHMKRDINVVVDVDPEEASLLIGLIEDLIAGWYITRYERDQRAQRIIAAAAGKKPQKAGGNG